MNPFTPINRLDSLFAPTLTRPTIAKAGDELRQLPLEVWETEDAYEVLVEVPGLEPSDLDITYHDDALTLKGERTPPEREGDRRLGRLSYGRFEQALRFGSAVEVDAISAEAKHGVITVRVPKAEAAKPRRIQITTGATPTTLEVDEGTGAVEETAADG